MVLYMLNVSAVCKVTKIWFSKQMDTESHYNPHISGTEPHRSLKIKITHKKNIKIEKIKTFGKIILITLGQVCSMQLF